MINPTILTHQKKKRHEPILLMHRKLEVYPVNPREMVFWSVSVHHRKDSHYPHFINLLNNVYCS